MKTLPTLSLEKTKDIVDINSIQQQNFEDMEARVRYIFTLFAQTAEYKKNDQDYKKTVQIIENIKADLQKELGRYDPSIVNKQTKSYYNDLEKYNCTEIYQLCDFVMKDTTGERDYKRIDLLYEVLYTYITDRAFANCRLDAKKVEDVLRQHNIIQKAELLHQLLVAINTRFWGNVVTIQVDHKKKTITFANESSGILDTIPLDTFFEKSK